MASHVIVVPEALPYPEFLSYLLLITSKNVFGYCSVTIVAIMILLSIFRYIKEKKIWFFQSVVDVISLLMNDNGTIKYHKLSPSERFMIVPLTFVGFVIAHGIFSNLQSYLTRPIHQPQINTIDVYRSPYQIFLHSPTFAVYMTRQNIKIRRLE